MTQDRIIRYHPDAADDVEKAYAQERKNQGDILITRGKNKGSEKQGDHAYGTASPGETVNFYYRDTPGKNFSERQKKECHIEHRAYYTDIGRAGSQPECKEGYDIARQKLPGNSVENIE
jgi:hypothetical protein